MSGTWTETTLGAVCDAGGGEVKTGPFGSQLHKSDYIEEGIPVVMPTNLAEGRISTEGIARIGTENVERLSHHKLEPGDIVYGRRGDIGRQALITEREKGWLCGTGCLRISLGKGEVDSKFLHYFLRDEKVISYIANQAVGATMPNLNTAILRSIPVRHPDLPTQRRIAGILSAYDDLIENNLRRIRILEEMAQSLYREWFVHFRFPGHESAKFVDSELGQIPKGWEVKTIADVCQSVSYGFTASASLERRGPKFLRITDIVPDQIDWASVPYCEISKEKMGKFLLQPGDIVVARTGATTGYAKRLNKLHPDTVFASYLVRARAKFEVSNRMLGILMESDAYKRFIQTNLSGSAQPQANAVVLTSMPMVVPDCAISGRFDQLVEPIIDQAELISIKNQNLRRTRDFLLPKLFDESKG